MPRLEIETIHGTQTAEFAAGTLLLHCLAGRSVAAVCGGKGTCGKCRVLARGGLSPMTAEERGFLTREEQAAGVRLACMTTLLGDATVFLQESGKAAVQTGFFTGGAAFVPEARFLERERAVGVAVDIGTTTVVGYYYDMKTGAQLAVCSGMNGQRHYGADVITRIGYIMEQKDGLHILQQAIVGQINEMTASVCDPQDLVAAVFTGNTVMEHIAAGVSPVSIAAAPFEPESKFGFSLQGRALGLACEADAAVYFPPCAAGYVGGDITAGIAASGMAEREEWALLIDIGTNGEMALGNRDGLLCCATAAGPAFEGAHIQRGCCGISGAVDTVTREQGALVYTTIGGTAPVGICGSGLIDALAVMVREGICDETGRLESERFDLDSEGTLYLTQKDVRELQLAKAAVAAGIRTLLRERGKRMEEIDRIWLCGGFGAHIRKESAAAIGLLPREKIEETVVLGNAAGAGAVDALLNLSARKKLDEIQKKTEYLELSGSGVFMDEYVEQMMFE